MKIDGNESVIAQETNKIINKNKVRPKIYLDCGQSKASK